MTSSTPTSPLPLKEATATPLGKPSCLEMKKKQFDYQSTQTQHKLSTNSTQTQHKLNSQFLQTTVASFSVQFEEHTPLQSLPARLT